MRTRIVIPVIAFLALVAPSLAAAQGPLGVGFVNDPVTGYVAPARDLPNTLRFIINWVLALVAILALGFLVYGGFRYIASRGDERELEEAKSVITNAVIGIVVIGIAAAIVNFVIGAVVGESCPFGYPGC